MKNIRKISVKIAFVLMLALTTASCNDWLREPSPGVNRLENYFTDFATAQQSVTACYVPLMWEYQSTFYSEWFIGDIVSDDALKGGGNISDMAAAYDMENWKTTTNNPLLLEFYRAQYQGIGRCNLSIDIVPKIPSDKDTLLSVEKRGITAQERLLSEAYFLRAYYYFRLVRVFGGVPKIDFIVDSSEKWKQPRASEDDIYQLIISDLEKAQAKLWLKSEYAAEDLGRATKGAAQAMLLKVNLYKGNYEKAKAWGDSVIQSGEYDLFPEYFDNFTVAGENGIESVFEIQYINDPQSDYGEGNGFSRGTFTQILTRSRSSKLGGGWGFNHPTQNLYDEYETNDPRRDKTIFTPDEDKIDNPEEEIYLGSKYLNKKIMWIAKDGTVPSLAHHARGPLNNRQIRYADVLLMYAEACAETGNLAAAKENLNRVRQRGGTVVTIEDEDEHTENVLPDFPNYQCSVWNGTRYVKRQLQDNQDDLRQAIRHERRVELGMEAHRWYDICRWGIAKEVMDAYAATETDEAKAEMAVFVKGQHELFPIPSEEIDLNPMTQNPGY
jgi:hypothetical protein